MNEVSPYVTVLIAVRNPDDFFAAAIKSILHQYFASFELIVVDDGSDEREIKNYQNLFSADKKIKFIRIEHRGLAGALNAGIKEAKGRFIARMDADDIALPDRLQNQVDFLNSHPDIDVVGTSYRVLHSNNSETEPKVPLLENDSDIRAALPKFNPLFHGSVIMRKDAVLAVGGYDESFTLAQDYDLWLRMSRKSTFANLPKVLMLRRENEKTVEKEARQNYFGLKARIKAISQGNLKFWHFIYLVRPFLVMVTPIWLKKIIRTFI